MTAKVVGEDEAGATTVAVIVGATTKVEVDVVGDVAAETMRHGVDRDQRRPRSFIAAQGLVDHNQPVSFKRDLMATNDCSTIILIGFLPFDPINSLYTRFPSYSCYNAVSDTKSHVGKRHWCVWND